MGNDTFLYICRSPVLNGCKIGYHTGSFYSLFKRYQTSFTSGVFFYLFETKSPEDHEKIVHRILRPYNISNEVFKTDKDNHLFYMYCYISKMVTNCEKIKCYSREKYGFSRIQGKWQYEKLERADEEYINDIVINIEKNGIIEPKCSNEIEKVDEEEDEENEVNIKEDDKENKLEKDREDKEMNSFEKDIVIGIENINLNKTNPIGELVQGLKKFSIPDKLPAPPKINKRYLANTNNENSNKKIRFIVDKPVEIIARSPPITGKRKIEDRDNEVLREDKNPQINEESKVVVKEISYTMRDETILPRVPPKASEENISLKNVYRPVSQVEEDVEEKYIDNPFSKWAFKGQVYKRMKK